MAATDEVMGRPYWVMHAQRVGHSVCYPGGSRGKPGLGNGTAAVRGSNIPLFSPPGIGYIYSIVGSIGFDWPSFYPGCQRVDWFVGKTFYFVISDIYRCPGTAPGWIFTPCLPAWRFFGGNGSLDPGGLSYGHIDPCDFSVVDRRIGMVFFFYGWHLVGSLLASILAAGIFFGVIGLRRIQVPAAYSQSWLSILLERSGDRLAAFFRLEWLYSLLRLFYLIAQRLIQFLTAILEGDGESCGFCYYWPCWFRCSKLEE